ncbi:MAG: transposase [Pseudarthrobacter sp.]|nr:transposase [Pseudarthrobacter sp.]
MFRTHAGRCLPWGRHAIPPPERLREPTSLADKRGDIGRDTVRQAWSDSVPSARKTPVRSSPRLEPFKPVIDAMLTEDTTAPPKQRYTARRILARLIEEHGRWNCRIRRCVLTCGSAGRRSRWRPDAGWRCLFRRNMRRALKPGGFR